MSALDRLNALYAALGETPAEKASARKYLRPKKRDFKAPTLADLPRDRSQPRDLEAKVPRGAAIERPHTTAVDDVLSLGERGLRSLGVPVENARQVSGGALAVDENLLGLGEIERTIGRIRSGTADNSDVMVVGMAAAPGVGKGVGKIVGKGAKALAKTPLGKIALEFGEDVASRVGSILGKDATEAEARTAAQNLVGAGTPNAPKAGPRNSANIPDLRALDTPSAIKAARKEPHLVPGPDGSFIGAPRGMKTKRQVTAQRKKFDEDVAAGAGGADWYTRARAANEDWAGRDPARQRLLAQEEALWSAQADPDTNLNFALQGHNAYEMGNPLEQVHTGQQARTYRNARDAGVNIPLGDKTGIYGQHLDPTQPHATTGTNDIWHFRGLGFGDTAKGGASTQQHRWADYETMLAVDRANRSGLGGRSDWLAHEIQAAPWVAGKARGLEKRYNLSAEEAMGRALRTYPDYGDKFTAFGTSEVVPYAGAGHVMGSHADDAAREAYSMDPRRSWSDADGRDITIDALGGWQRPSLRATGVYKPPIEGAAVETNPVFVSRPLVGLPRGGGVDDASRGMMDLSGAVKGYIDAQGASAWHKPLRGRTGAQAGSLFVPTEGASSPETLLKLRDIAERHGLGDIVDTGQGVTMTNFMGAPAGKDTRKALKGGLDDEITALLGSHPQQVGMDGGYTSLFELESEPGSGVVTDALLEMIDKYPESVRHRLDASEALRARARSGMEADAEGLFGPARPDIQNSRQAIAAGGFTGLAAARKAGVALPSLAALMALYGLEESPQASVDGGL